MMQDRAKRLAAWVAILAIALQAIFAGFGGGPAIAAPLDPATIICHAAPSDDAPTQPAPAGHDDCCSQCILCSVTIFALETPAIVTAPGLPRRSAQLPSPRSSFAPPPHGEAGGNFARGPPFRA
jgi:hypothetical protein